LTQKVATLQYRAFLFACERAGYHIGMKEAGAAAEALLQRMSLRRTPVRVGVLELLAGSSEPLDVPQILAKLPSRTDAVTVYRTLNTFTRKKLVHRIRGEDRSWRYAIGDSHQEPRHQHPHFVCEECGKVECLTTAEIPRGFVRSLGVGGDYAISYPEVVLHGICPRCH
jgi:Fur family transcriptional regulator, ferric uptake regulator